MMESAESKQYVVNYLEWVFGGEAFEFPSLLTGRYAGIKHDAFLSFFVRVQQRLQSWNVTETRVVEPRVGIPLIESAVWEKSPQLIACWEVLLAYALNPQSTFNIEPNHVQSMKELNALDLFVLNYIYTHYFPDLLFGYAKNIGVALKKKYALDLTDTTRSIQKLFRLFLIFPGNNVDFGSQITRYPEVIHTEFENAYLTYFGREFSQMLFGEISLEQPMASGAPK